MKRTRKAKVVEFGSQDWFRKVGETTLFLGSENFHEALITLFGCLIEHSACWIIRFSDAASPEIMYTRGVPQNLRDHYRSACSSVDPFAAHWRIHKEIGVRALSRFKGMLGAVDTRSYNALFKPAANVTDELGLFLPTIGNASIGLFLERERGVFDDDEIERAKAAFPVVNSLEKAHIGRVFDGMQSNGSLLEAARLNPHPILVQDRYGVEIFASLSWADAVADEPALSAVVLQFANDSPIMLEKYIVNIERFEKYFPLAPGGRMLTLSRCPEVSAQRGAVRARTELSCRLTPRERDIFNMVLGGRSTSDISRLLSISKGTVKNYTLRIYKKAGINSRRALIQQYVTGLAPG